MLTQLHTYYGDDMILDGDYLSDEYTWFLVEQKKVGIRKSRLHPKEQELLSSLLTPIVTNTYYKTKQEKFWYEALYHDKPISISSTQFIHFFTNNAIVEQDEFQEALQSIFALDTTIVWETPRTGVIILEETTSDYPLQTIIDTIEADFFISISFLVGRTYTNTQSDNLSTLYKWEREFFKQLPPYLQKKIIYMEHILPYQFIRTLPKEVKEEYIHRVLENVLNDKELLHTVTVFFQCNLNISLASKKLYIHRNSLQYRIDKFIEKTGINIKTFEGAATVYLAFFTLNIYKREQK